MSLKPFRVMTQEYIEGVLEGIYQQWRPLIRDADVISILLWTADGSEILEYQGNPDQEIQWCNLIGGANPKQGWNKKIDPEGLGLHTRNYPYMEHPPILTYEILRMIVDTIKKTGRRIFPDKEIRVGETFDPGPEFAKSEFKYERHKEICVGESMGEGSMVCCYTTLHEDSRAYAGFPDGIREGTPFGTFLGRQSQVFLKDMGFDYLWLSNGFGFGTETWGTTGAIFDGERFHTENFQDVRRKVLDFWNLFRAECPDIPLETRGTNMSAGIDYATDGVPLKEIYDGGYHLLPPPNSPWAALDGDFGLELAGYMSRISHLPGEDFLFRYYIHDPWWVNSPWYDRYEGQPHDIYLPLAIGHIDQKGAVSGPSHLNILTIDNSFGEMPESCVNEPLPHIKRALKEMPDTPSPLVWLYPFTEYMEAQSEARIQEMFSEDWYIRGAINEGLPLSSVMNTDDYLACRGAENLFAESILIVPVPKADTALEKKLLSYAEKGGKIIFYGSVKRAGTAFLNWFHLTVTEEAAGSMAAEWERWDSYDDGREPAWIMHRELVNAGGVNTVAESSGPVEVFASQNNKAVGVQRSHSIWLRATVSGAYTRGSRLLVPDERSKYSRGESLLRTAAARLGYAVRFHKKGLQSESPVLMVHRKDKAYFFSVYSPDTTVKTTLKFPLGAPVLMGYETCLEDGCSTYYFPRSEHRECRVFVMQEDGIVSAREIPPVSYQMRRRIQVAGLKNATVRFFPEAYCRGEIEAVLNSHSDNYFVGDTWEGEYHSEEGYFEYRNITGQLVLSMPRRL